MPFPCRKWKVMEFNNSMLNCLACLFKFRKHISQSVALICGFNVVETVCADIGWSSRLQLLTGAGNRPLIISCCTTYQRSHAADVWIWNRRTSHCDAAAYLKSYKRHALMVFIGRCIKADTNGINFVIVLTMKPNMNNNSWRQIFRI